MVESRRVPPKGTDEADMDMCKTQRFASLWEFAEAIIDLDLGFREFEVNGLRASFSFFFLFAFCLFSVLNLEDSVTVLTARGAVPTLSSHV